MGVPLVLVFHLQHFFCLSLRVGRFRLRGGVQRPGIIPGHWGKLHKFSFQKKNPNYFFYSQDCNLTFVQLDPVASEDGGGGGVALLSGSREILPSQVSSQGQALRVRMVSRCRSRGSFRALAQDTVPSRISGEDKPCFASFQHSGIIS